MAVQFFLQGKLLHIEEFVTTFPSGEGAESLGLSEYELFLGRCFWVSLLVEVLPRALLAELGLPKILLGASGAGQFLLILPAEAEGAAREFLNSAAAHIRELSGGRLQLIWGTTEALGDWVVVRRRLQEELRACLAPTEERVAAGWFEPFEPASDTGAAGYFVNLARQIREARTVGWAPDRPGEILVNEGRHQWPLEASADGIRLPRHVAVGEDGSSIASLQELAARSDGTRRWGVLRGDVDDFGERLRRCHSIEEHVQASVLYKEFFAGELEVLCSMPEFWRKVTLLYAGGDDFAVAGAWDALLLFAREFQRVFHRFNEESLKELPGPEGRTISMALALAPELDTPLVKVFREAGRRLEEAKATDKDRFHVFGRVVEWRHLNHAVQLKDTLLKLAGHHEFPGYILADLQRLYKEDGLQDSGRSDGFSRPWRYYRRLSLAAGKSRDRDFQRLRSQTITELIGKTTTEARLRPGGRIALQWARMLTEA